MSKIHLSLPNAYKLMCFDRNVNGNRDVKFLECDKWSLHWYENLTLAKIQQTAVFLSTRNLLPRISQLIIQKP